MVVGVESNCKQHHFSADRSAQLYAKACDTRLLMLTAFGGRNALQAAVQDKAEVDYHSILA